MKKLTAILLTFILCFGILSVAFAAENEAPVAEIPEGYTAIYTAEDLNNIRNNLSGKYIMMNDIDLSVYENWVPIGTEEAPFTGVFDGGSFTVDSLKITSLAKDADYAGLFGKTQLSEIKNLTVTGNIDITKPDVCAVGLICAFAESTNILNCVTNGNVNVSTETGGSFAGMAGVFWKYDDPDNPYSDSITVKIFKCENNANVSVNGICNTDEIGATLFVGGITAQSRERISGCVNKGNITADGKKGIDYYNSMIVGGICGRIRAKTDNCYNIGNISVHGMKYTHVGGIAGSWTPFEDLLNCFNIGNIKNELSNPEEEWCEAYTGGITGELEGIAYPCDSYYPESPEDESKIINCYYLDNIELGVDLNHNSHNIVSLTKLTAEDFAKQESFVGFDFENVWEMDNEKGYPVLSEYTEIDEPDKKPEGNKDLGYWTPGYHAPIGFEYAGEISVGENLISAPADNSGSYGYYNFWIDKTGYYALYADKNIYEIYTLESIGDNNVGNCSNYYKKFYVDDIGEIYFYYLEQGEHYIGIETNNRNTTINFSIEFYGEELTDVAIDDTLVYDYDFIYYFEPDSEHGFEINTDVVYTFSSGKSLWDYGANGYPVDIYPTGESLVNIEFLGDYFTTTINILNLADIIADVEVANIENYLTVKEYYDNSIKKTLPYDEEITLILKDGSEIKSINDFYYYGSYYAVLPCGKEIPFNYRLDCTDNSMFIGIYVGDALLKKFECRVEKATTEENLDLMKSYNKEAVSDITYWLREAFLSVLECNSIKDLMRYGIKDSVSYLIRTAEEFIKIIKNTAAFIKFYI